MKRKTKKVKLKKIPKLIKEAHNAWSAYIRARDKRCQVCGKTDNLHAHHCIVPQKRGNSTRFLADNGISLCFWDHMFMVHKGLGGVEFNRRLQSAIDRICSKERQEEIIRLSHEVKKYDRSELEEIIETFNDLCKKEKMKERNPSISSRPSTESTTLDT